MQLSLVDINNFYTVPVKKRGNYKEKQKYWYQCTILLYCCNNFFLQLVGSCLYLYLDSLYRGIANFLPLERDIFNKDDSSCIFHNTRVWLEYYQAVPFFYEGEWFEGEEFSIKSAELVGSETLSLIDRILLHEEFYKLLSDGIDLMDAAETMQPKIKACEKPKTVTEQDKILLI